MLEATEKVNKLHKSGKAQIKSNYTDWHFKVCLKQPFFAFLEGNNFFYFLTFPSYKWTFWWFF